MNALVERLGTLSDGAASTDSFVEPPAHIQAAESTAAPVFLIRDVATEVGLKPNQRTAARPEQTSDIISRGLLTMQDALYMLSLCVSRAVAVELLTNVRFQEHYGRWVAFDEAMRTERLLAQVRKSPLLLCSCCLIAIRHTREDLAVRLAPSLFREAKDLLSTSLLTVPQSIEFFQAVIVLSLWSTTIGQVPLSIDSWLLTGYALQHCLATTMFDPVLNSAPESSPHERHLNRYRIWNHLCLAHLQQVFPPL